MTLSSFRVVIFCHLKIKWKLVELVQRKTQKKILKYMNVIQCSGIIWYFITLSLWGAEYYITNWRTRGRSNSYSRYSLLSKRNNEICRYISWVANVINIFHKSLSEIENIPKALKAWDKILSRLFISCSGTSSISISLSSSLASACSPRAFWIFAFRSLSNSASIFSSWVK